MKSMPNTDSRWKSVAVVAALIVLVSIAVNVYFYLSDESEIASGVNNTTNNLTILNISDKNETGVHRIARVAVTPGNTISID